MAVIEVHKFEHKLLGVVALAFLVSYQNDGAYWRAESHLVLSDPSQPCLSDLVKFDSRQGSTKLIELDDTFMLGAALGQARARFLDYVAGLPELRGNLLLACSVSPASSSDVLQVWIRGALPKMTSVCQQTESDSLREHVQAIVKFPTIITLGL